MQQAKRYSRGFAGPDAHSSSSAGTFGDGGHRLSFVFSSNGRPYLRQLATRTDNLGHVLDGWYTPEGFTALLKRDEYHAHDQLRNSPFAYGFSLRPYQRSAIQAARPPSRKGNAKC